MALGLLVNALFPSIPLGLAVACGDHRHPLVVARDGWLALFVAAAVPGDSRSLPVLCIIILPAWLLVSARSGVPHRARVAIHQARAVEVGPTHRAGARISH